MTPEAPFQNPFVDSKTETDMVDPDDWGLNGDWVEVGLVSALRRVRLIKGGSRSTSAENTDKVGLSKPIEP